MKFGSSERQFALACIPVSGILRLPATPLQRQARAGKVKAYNGGGTDHLVPQFDAAKQVKAGKGE